MTSSKNHDEPIGKAHTTAAPAPKAATPRDTSADQTKLLLMLAADWLNGDRTHAREIAALLASIHAAQEPPVNVDVPLVIQEGGVLNCTMGNWKNEPAGYAYAWHTDGIANGMGGPTYTVQPTDSGKSIACAVTATNAIGSTTAPMSNAITIA